ncbi:unnamed protein product [Rotaria magnacalcarata]|uniref:Macro domain-containing protein n=2 Tax=Rotaria magnacalcarata TaxID=392030 RepID=A0A816LD47_9BILA|nr:unnamed protein product [Rotaria magnacalcarata]CAF4013040.1 unnamed protein product [Rotaria magnacalcarata]CAF4192821.1 unnamed protein product [Rotaria magnacalcarata]
MYNRILLIVFLMKFDLQQFNLHKILQIKRQLVDVIVVCLSSKHLFNAICKVGGDSFRTSFNAESKKNPGAPIIAVKAEGQLASKKIYCLPWEKDSNVSLSKSIRNFVSAAIVKAVTEKQLSIAFAAIGCGNFQCPLSLVAQAMVETAYRKLQKHAISVSFAIEPKRLDIYDEFQKQINLLEQPSQTRQPAEPVKTIAATIGN